MTTLFDQTATTDRALGDPLDLRGRALMSNGRDITGRNRAEAALRRSEAGCRTMLQGVQAGVIVHGADGRITAFNALALELLGVTEAQITARTPFDPLWSRVRADGTKLGDADLPSSRACATRQPVRDFILGVNRPASGDFVWLLVNANPVLTGEGDIAEVIVTFMDVTARLRAEREVRENARFTEDVLNSLTAQVVVLDEGGTIIAVNEAWRRFARENGAGAADFVGQNYLAVCREGVTADDNAGAERAAAGIRAVLAGGQTSFTLEYPCHAPGPARWFRMRVTPLGGGHRGVVVSHHDITERKQLEEQVRQAQKMEAIGTLAGGIAHDFNNILASIVGYTELSRMILQGNPEVGEYLGAVLQASSRATDLVRQILAFSRQQQVERRPIQLRPVVVESLELLRATIPSTIAFETSLASDAPVVLADPTQVHQILMNLGTNAWHAMKDRPGRLQVKLEKCVVDEAHAATQSRLHPGVYARVSVSDTGCGMDQTTVGRIFEPFFTTKPLGEGTGLGLAVVHGIMGSHDGAVTVYSHPGEGTVFHVYFPAHAGVATGVAVKDGAVPRGHGERILLVDDEELLVRLGQQTLTVLGYEVEVTTQPAAALAMVRADPERYALVFTDQTMPGMTGLSLANELRQIRPGLPVILMSGYCLSLTPERVAAAGIRQLLLKPIAVDALADAVHAAISAKSPRPVH